MTLSVAAGVCAALAGIGLFAQAIDLWLGKEKTRRLNDLVKRFHTDYSTSNPRDSLFLPIYLLGAVYDCIFGKRIISSHAFYRSMWLMAGLLAVALSVEGLITGVHFGINTPPWEFSSESSQMVDVMVKKLSTDPKFTDYSRAPLLLSLFKNWGLFLNSPVGQISYTCLFVAVITMANALLSFTSIVISRMFLKEILTNNGGARSMIFLLAVDLFILISGSSVLLLLFVLLIMPALWPMVPLLFYVGLEAPQLFMYFFGISIPLSWAVCSTWLKIGACVAATPTVLIMVTFLFGHTGRKFMKSAFVFFIGRGLEYDKGFLAYIVVAVGVVGSLIALFVSAAK